MDRKDIAFPSGADSCAAWFYPAVGGEPDVPVVVMAHGLSGTRRDRLGAFAERFAAAGFAALVFDHRGFGDSGGEPDLFDPGGSSRIGGRRSRLRARCRGSMRAGWRRLALRWEGATRLPLPRTIPPSQPRSARFPSSTSSRQAHRSSPLVTARTLAAAARGAHLPAVGQPNEPALINAPGGEEGWRRVVSIGEDSRWRNRVSSRWLLGAPYRPSKHAAKLHCPWLVCVGEADRVAKPGPAICGREARAQGRATHLSRRRPLRHLRRPGARGARRRPGRVPAPAPALGQCGADIKRPA